MSQRIIGKQAHQKILSKMREILIKYKSTSEVDRILEAALQKKAVTPEKLERLTRIEQTFPTLAADLFKTLSSVLWASISQFESYFSELTHLVADVQNNLDWLATVASVKLSMPTTYTSLLRLNANTTILRTRLGEDPVSTQALLAEYGESTILRRPSEFVDRCDWFTRKRQLEQERANKNEELAHALVVAQIPGVNEQKARELIDRYIVRIKSAHPDVVLERLSQICSEGLVPFLARRFSKIFGNNSEFQNSLAHMRADKNEVSAKTQLETELTRHIGKKKTHKLIVEIEKENLRPSRILARFNALKKEFGLIKSGILLRKGAQGLTYSESLYQEWLTSRRVLVVELTAKKERNTELIARLRPALREQAEEWAGKRTLAFDTVFARIERAEAELGKVGARKLIAESPSLFVLTDNTSFERAVSSFKKEQDALATLRSVLTSRQFETLIRVRKQRGAKFSTLAANYFHLRRIKRCSPSALFYSGNEITEHEQYLRTKKTIASMKRGIGQFLRTFLPEEEVSRRIKRLTTSKIHKNNSTRSVAERLSEIVNEKGPLMAAYAAEHNWNALMRCDAEKWNDIKKKIYFSYATHSRVTSRIRLNHKKVTSLPMIGTEGTVVAKATMQGRKLLVGVKLNGDKNTLLRGFEAYEVLKVMYALHDADESKILEEANHLLEEIKESCNKFGDWYLGDFSSMIIRLWLLRSYAKEIDGKLGGTLLMILSDLVEEDKKALYLERLYSESALRLFLKNGEAAEFEPPTLDETDPVTPWDYLGESDSDED